MKKFKDFYEAYNFLSNHKMVQIPYPKDSEYMANFFGKCLSVEVVKVNPKTEIIDYDNKKESKTQVWLEFGPIEYEEYSSNNVIPVHDCNLDCSGDTFEEAIINLANLVKLYYNNDGTEIKLPEIKSKTKHYILKETPYLLSESIIYDSLERELDRIYSLINLETRKPVKTSEEDNYNGVDIYDYTWEEIKEEN